MGLGLVLQTDPGTVTVLFPASGETRTYAVDSAPLRRVEFGPGDTVELQDGSSFVVESVADVDGLLTYHGGGQEMQESGLGDLMGFHQPHMRLLGGRVNSSRKFRLRCRALEARASMRGRRERGLMGARIDLVPHQLFIADEVGRRHFPRVLLADEVGLGKTIEACLIMHRKLVAGRISRVLILVPEPLIHQWFIELLRRFTLHFSIYDEARCAAIEAGGSDAENEAPHEENINPFLDDQLILASIDLLADNPQRAAQAVAAGWDMLIVDEAHHLGWSPDEVSDEYTVVEKLATGTDDLLLLTGTPGQLKPEGHFARLRLLDPDRFSDLDEFLVETRDAVEVSAIAAKVETGTALNATEKKELSAWLGGEVPEAPEEVLRKLLDLHGTGRVMFRNRRANLGGFPEREALLYPLEPIADDPDADPRVAWLIDKLTELDEAKVLVICRTRELAEQLEAALAEKLRVKVALFHEGLELIKRDRNAAYFAEEDGARLLICSEIGSEGRNFQFAHHLVLYDLPPEPSLLEQRIGRLDRIGQRETVRIHVPFQRDTDHATLARWYHEGMDAFETPMEGGSKLLEQFAAEMEKASPGDSAAVEAKTALDAELETGRDRLLEMSSFNATAAEQLVEAVGAIDADNTLRKLQIDLFDQLGVAVEELGDHSYFIKPDTVFAADAFPGMREIGMSITFDRATANANERMAFVTWDHPMVSTCIDLMLNGEQGSSAFGQISGTAAQAGLIAECVFLLEPICPPVLGADRFLAPQPVRAVIDHGGADITASFESGKVKDGDRGWLRSKLEVIGRMVPTMVDAAEKVAEISAVKLRADAAEKMEAYIGDDLDRLQRLRTLGHPVRDSEFAAAESEREALRKHLGKARLRLESIRLVVVGG